MLILRAFGTLDFLDETGASVPALMAQPKRAALLAYLIVAHPGSHCRRDTLLALFWPELDDDHGRNALSQALSFLRSHLPEGILVSRGPAEVGVDASRVRSDVRAFRSALEEGKWAEVAALYRGELMEGLHVAGSAPFTDWLDRERWWFRERAADAAWRHARLLLTAGRLNDAALAARRARELVPSDEAAVRDFVHDLAAAGDRAAALRFYAEFERILDGELALEPAEETKAVAAAVRAGLVRGPAARAEPPASEAPTPPPPARAALEDAPPPAPALSTSRTGRPVTWALVLAGVLAVGAWALRDAELPSPGPGERAPVAVLPFAVHGGDDDLAAAGVQAALLVLQGLEEARLGDATVHRDGDGAPWTRRRGRSAVRATGAATLVTGDIAVRGDVVEVSARMVRGSDLETLWTFGPESAPVAELSAALAAVREHVLGAVAWYLGPEMALHSAPEIYQPPPSLAVARLAARAHERSEAGDREGALDQYRAAFALDTTWLHGALEVAKYSSAYAFAWWMRDGWSGGAGTAQRDSVVRFLEARRGRLWPGDALQLDVFLAGGRPAGQLYEAARSLAEADSFFLAPMLMQAALWKRRPAEALEIYERLPGSRVMASPLWSGRAHFQAGEAYHMLGRFEEERALAREARARDPGIYIHYSREMRALAAMGRAEEMERLIEASYALDIPDPDIALLNEAQVELRAHGPPELAREVATRLLERIEGRPPGFAWDQLRYALEVLGRYEEAWLLWEESSRRAGNDLGYRIRGVRDRILMGDTTGAAALADSARTAPMEAFSGFGWSNRAQPMYFGAQVLGMLGREAEALAMLREALNSGFRLTRDEELQWYWAPLRHEPGFQEIMRLRDGG